MSKQADITLREGIGAALGDAPKVPVGETPPIPTDPYKSSHFVPNAAAEADLMAALAEKVTLRNTESISAASNVTAPAVMPQLKGGSGRDGVRYAVKDTAHRGRPRTPSAMADGTALSRAESGTHEAAHAISDMASGPTKDQAAAADRILGGADKGLHEEPSRSWQQAVTSRRDEAKLQTNTGKGGPS
jgi:hypothetical protein